MDVKLLKESVEVLKQLRSELHGKAEDSVIEQLDKVIFDLDTAQQADSDKLNAVDALKMLGTVVELIPAIAELIRLISGTK